jgi:hypothetical protein
MSAVKAVTAMGTLWMFSERRSAVTTISCKPPDSVGAAVAVAGASWATTAVAPARSKIPLTTRETD